MTLLYAGIDEAGYGPMLGPLCVGMAVFRVREWAPGDPAPDLWQRLAPAVVRTAKESKSGVPIGDSKKLKLSNQSVTRHPLTHLERGVLAALAAAAPDHATHPSDAALFTRLGADLGSSPWYGAPADLPCANAAGMLRIDAAQIASAMHRAGIELVDLRVTALDEPSFNRVLAQKRSKAAVVEGGLEGHLRTALGLVGTGETLRVVADRQSGRTHYGQVLSRVFSSVEPEEESARASRYRVDGHHGVILHSEAEDAHLPVALASMAAKLVRELAMARFNRYWSGRMADLKPTAGYVQDARRWLEDIGAALSGDERESIVRKA